MAKHVIDFSIDAAPVHKRRLLDIPGCVVSGDPHHSSQVFFTNPSQDVIAGTWTSTPGKWHAFSDKDEFCYIVCGHVRLISEDGHIQTFKTGDSFLIPNGFVGFWEVVEPTTKHFVIRQY